MNPLFLSPDWPAPQSIKAFTTQRQGGFSSPPFDSLNLASHVGDDEATVNKNRQHLNQIAQLPEAPRWLNQTHGTHVINSKTWAPQQTADAIVSNTANHVCAVLTADCLPVLLCDQQGTTVAAIHAGWRGLADGIIEQSIAQFPSPIKHIMAWLGPAIGPTQFEVGHDVYQTFIKHSPEAKQAFVQTNEDHFLADLYMLASQRLNHLGISAIYGGQFCTQSEPNRFFSYRHQSITGRMASIIWIDPD